jgi:hypothetical protein
MVGNLCNCGGQPLYVVEQYTNRAIIYQAVCYGRALLVVVWFFLPLVARVRPAPLSLPWPRSLFLRLPPSMTVRRRSSGAIQAARRAAHRSGSAMRASSQGPSTCCPRVPLALLAHVIVLLVRLLVTSRSG